MEGTRIFCIACKSGDISAHRNATLAEHPFCPAHSYLYEVRSWFIKEGREKILISFTLS